MGGENCRHLTVVGLHDTGPRSRLKGLVAGSIPKIVPLTNSKTLTAAVFLFHRPTRERKIAGSNPACAGIFRGSSHTSDSHMHGKLKLASSPTCPSGQEDQTTGHVLQRCPLHKATREDVWPVSSPLTTKFCSCKQELEQTTSFVSRAALIV